MKEIKIEWKRFWRNMFPLLIDAMWQIIEFTLDFTIKLFDVFAHIIH